MFYTTCENACPLLVSIMQQIETALPAELQPQVGFILVTFAPEHDTPPILRAYREKRHLDSQRWTLLHGQPDAVLELAVLLGVNYTKATLRGFAHTNLLTVLHRRDCTPTRGITGADWGHAGSNSARRAGLTCRTRTARGRP